MSFSSDSSSDSDEINMAGASNDKNIAPSSSSDSESEEENKDVKNMSQDVKKNETPSSSNGSGDSSSDSESESATDTLASMVHKSVFGSDSEDENDANLENKVANKEHTIDEPEFSSSDSENETNISSVINKSVIQSLPSESNSDTDDEFDTVQPTTEQVVAQSEIEDNSGMSGETGEDLSDKNLEAKPLSQSSTSNNDSSSDGEEDDASTTLKSTRKDVFGSDSESEEDVSPKTQIHQRSTKEIFGDDQDDLSSDSETGRSKSQVNNAQANHAGLQYIDDDAEVGSGGELEAPVPEDTRIQVDFPLIRANLGKQIHFVKLPNFLSVETRPFDPATYEDELDEDDLHDEEGRARLKLKVENTVRWRYARDADGNERHDEYGAPIRESNAKFMRWSDGSLSLHLGSEIFDVHVMETSNDYNHLFIRQGSGLQGQAVFGTKLTFRPHSIDSYTHRKITMSLADKSTKQQMVKFLPIAGKDPTVQHQEAMKREEEGFRASLRRENQQRRIRERVSSKGRLSAAFIEDEADKDGNSTSIAAIKRKAKERRSVSAVYSSSDDDSLSSDSSDDAAGKKKKARVISDDEEEEVEITGSKSVVNDATSSSASDDDEDDDDNNENKKVPLPAAANSKGGETSSIRKAAVASSSSSSDSDTSISD